MIRSLTRLTLLVLPLLLFPTAPVQAQDLATLRAGDRVRLVSGMHRGVYHVAEVPDLVLVDRAGNRLALDRSDIDRLDVRVGQESRLRSSIRGSMIGGGAGALTGGVLAYVTEGDDGFFSRGDMAVIGGILGGAAGFVGGAVIGATMPRSRWVGLVPATRIGISPSGGSGARVSLSIAM